MSSNKAAMIPSTVTFANLFCGFFSIVKSIEGNFHAAAWFIIVSAIVDATDGRLARWTGGESRFGLQLDSLCDIVSFGVAPAVLVLLGVFGNLTALGVPLAFFYLCGGAYRLARFNVLNTDQEEHYYVGLTIPIAAITVASFWLFQAVWFDTVVLPWWILLCVLLPLLMASTIPYHWPRISFKNGWKRTALSAGILCALALMLAFPDRTAFLFFALFLAVGMVNWTVSMIRGEETLPGLFLLTRRNES
jgi:CDP-diacylglycerol---serine O-phosphatidyltransferase